MHNCKLLYLTQTHQMKIIVKSISVILILYSLFLLIQCIPVIGNLTEYGKGILTGSILILFIGVALQFIKFKKNEKKTHLN
jgi:hypothetical protein